MHLATVKHVDHLVKIGVFVPTQQSEWALPSFIIPKKDWHVHWMTQQSHQVQKYPLLIILDILQKCSGYNFFTKLDISIQYYTFELDEEKKNLCTIITPFGKYKYARLLMGLTSSTDIAQSIMESVISGIDDANVYIDNVGAFQRLGQPSATPCKHLKLSP
ncbi:hypothetical protein ACHAW6_003393 [Cyclotella cf. meneghiniana]